MKSIYRHIPNTLTSLNLFCGSLSIMLAFQGNLLLSAYLLLIAFHFDIFDGLSARLLKVSSDIGKELDSLADVISFGLAPAALLVNLIMPALDISKISLRAFEMRELLVLIPFILPVFAAIRLARFNIRDSMMNGFMGVPSPANGIMVLSIPLIANNHPDSFLVHWFNLPGVIIAYSIIVSLLMVSHIPLYSFKMKGFKWKANKYTYSFLAGIAVILVIFGYSGLFLSVVFYLVYGFILALLLRRKKV